MKTMFAAFAISALISVGAYYGLHAAGFGAAEHTVSVSVRLDD
ncbi:hypothetical protein [Yoonia sp.]|nr:hypothetical protein [Yoonia sp.]